MTVAINRRGAIIKDLFKINFSKNSANAVYLFFSIFVISIIGYLTYSLYTNELEVLKKSLKSYSEITEESVSSDLKLIFNTLYHIDLKINKSSKEFSSMTNEGLISYMKHLDKTPYIELRLADDHGNIIASTARIPFRFSANQKSYFTVHKKEKAPSYYISEPFLELPETSHVVVISRKIVSKNGKFLGVVLASLDARFFSSYRERLNLGNHSLFVITTGRDNRFAYRFPEIKNIIGTKINPHPNTHPVFLKSIHRGIYEVNSVKDSVHRYISMSWVGEYPVLIIIGKDYAPFMNKWANQSLILIFLIICTLLAGYFLLLRFIKHNEATSLHQAQLSKSSRLIALGEMSASVAHEINNPLTIIIMNLRKIEKRIAEKNITIDEIERSLSKTKKMSERIAKIVNGLKIFSRQQSSHKKSISLLGIINEVYNISKEKFKENGILLTISCEHDDLFIYADETQIMQVLINLLNNSFDASVNKDNQWVRIKVLKNDASVRVEVSDSGVGISKDLTEKVMEPFFTTKAFGKGAGLGLTTSKGIIEQHNGKFWYDKMARVTTFVIEIPLAPLLIIEEKSQAA